MPTISLNAFMKNWEKRPPAKATAYSKYLTPGGYDFYWRLTAEAAALTLDAKPYSACEAVLLGIKRECEREHNLAGLKQLSKWLGTQMGELFEPPEAQCMSPKGHLAIRLKPIFGIEVESGRRLIHLWNTAKPEMTTRTASVGLYLMKEHLVNGEFADCNCAILDLRKNHLFIAEALPTNVAEDVARELAWIDWFFEQAKESLQPGISATLTHP